ncbi:glycosyltransferase [Bosea sp. BH3]|uniref:glycosyltransferase n=1 Tax=Bosea sp. BH3 TaxID=2871701 RepID=UPI0021CB58BC|nr:glycosyltransferase [Bosea sp. BH3]MCU4181114.1 glycosyltransferase [Bosea sp. BH3]
MTVPAPFAINGRFLTQSLTGVQRYARNVVAALDDTSLGREATLLAPQGATDPGLTDITLRRVGPLSGHAWEQAVLPLRAEGRLLNLCNTAPALKRDQIVCIHDANVFTAPESYGRAFRTLYGTLQPLLARRAARITTVSQASARQIARYLPLRAQDIAVLPNGHEHALAWNPARADYAPLILAQLDGRPFVLALGSQARHKNLKLLVDAAPALAGLGIEIVVAGGGGGVFAPETLAAAPNLHAVGRVSDDDLAFLMERALGLVFPSWTEGFGLPIVEAMARGCPVVSSDRASMPEVCGDAALMASPADPAAWIAHVKALRDEPSLRTELIGRGHEQVKAFSWRATAEGYAELMRQPLARLPARPAAPPSVKIAVAIATRGRPEIVAATVKHLLATQTLKPTTTIISCIDPADAGDLVAHKDVTVVTGPAGLAAQRNTALAHLPAETEIVVFFDDDFVAHGDWLSVAAQSFRDEAELVCFTGRVVADGVTGPGVGFEEALRLVAAAAPSGGRWTEPFSPYGCNMAFRASAIEELRFDERLVLYGWLEDRDFGSALARRGGRLVKSPDATGVHMGVKGGRLSGERLGYSQVANPLYMLLKGTMTPRQVAGQLFRNLASNFGKAFRPEPFIDRRGRVRGNLIAFADLLRGRLAPERAALLDPRPSPPMLQPQVKTR